jgi:hypothetical protein
MKRGSSCSRAVSPTLRLVIAVSVVGATLFAAGAASSAARAAAGVQRFTYYSSIKNERYINNVDDLSRGEGHNPFGNVSSVKPPTNEKVSGPLAGDESMFAFNLFTDPNLKTSAGSVIFVCWYNFNRNGLCDAAFQLKGGTLIGKGALNFSDEDFTLALIGGTSKYRSMGGAVQITALGAKTQAQPVIRVVPMLQAQKLSFVVEPA